MLMVEILSVLSLMLESSTLVHHQTTQPIAAMRGRRGVSMSNAGVGEVEHGHFIPLVFTTTGGMADAADHVYRRLVNLL